MKIQSITTNEYLILVRALELKAEYENDKSLVCDDKIMAQYYLDREKETRDLLKDIIIQVNGLG